MIKIAAVQMEPKLGEVEANRSAIVGRLREAAAAGAKLAAFPECALTGYCFESKAEAMEFAEPIPGPSSRIVADACHELGVSALFGMLERDGDRLYNAAALVGPEGVIGSYRKIHLPYLGVDMHATPGDRPFAVHDAAGMRVGMYICYDGSFPESARVLALLGADLLALITNWPTHSECAAEAQTRTRAMENVCYSLAANRVGTERGFRFIGRSSIADPSGNVLAQAGPDEEVILYADVDPARARNKRLVRVPGKHEIDRIKDRRPEMYRPLVE